MAYNGVVYQIDAGITSDSIKKIWGEVVPKDAVIDILMAPVNVIEKYLDSLEKQLASHKNPMVSTASGIIRPVREAEISEMKDIIRDNSHDCNVEDLERIVEVECDQLMQFVDFMYAPPNAAIMDSEWYKNYYEKYKDRLDPSGMALKIGRGLAGL